MRLGAAGFAELLSIPVDEVEAGRRPASKMRFEDGMIPWLGDPNDSFFNPLYKHFSARHG